MKRKSTWAIRLKNAWAALRGEPVACNPVTQATPSRYHYEITCLDNLVSVALYEAVDGGRVEVARSRGHILYTGAEGVAQAASYAMRGIWGQMQAHNNNKE